MTDHHLQLYHGALVLSFDMDVDNVLNALLEEEVDMC
jgi:hypothetical protein